MTSGAYHVQFIGVDGAGKSAQAVLLHQGLLGKGVSSVLCEGKDDFSLSLMQSVARQQGRGGDGYAAAVAYFGLESTMVVQVVDMLRDQYRMVLPHLHAGSWVVQSRSIEAKLAFARSQGATNLSELTALSRACRPADLAIYLEVPAATALARVDARGIDAEDPAILGSTVDSLREMAGEYGWLRVDGDRPHDEVHADVWQAVAERLLADGRPAAGPA